jgi:hypothetical protein
MASPASRCTSNTIAFFMGRQLARHWTRGQGSRIAVEVPLNYEFAMFRETKDQAQMLKVIGRPDFIKASLM